MVAGGVLRCHLIGKMNFDGIVGGVLRRSSLQGFYPLTNQRIPHLLLFYNIHFSRTKIKIFLKAPLAPIYTDFERGARAKKSNFFVKLLQKVPKNGFLGTVVSIICLHCKNFWHKMVFIVFWECTENQFGRP